MDPRQDFRTELTLFSDSIFREDRSVVDLLRANHTYLNERLALQYGITDVKGDEFRRVELKDSARWGLLGKGAILMAAAYPNRTSPVLRGKFILSYIEGVPPANPPPNVPTLNDKDIGTTKALTVRELMAKHRASPTCSSCHAIMDPLGFALENFDATGMWRDKDRFANTVDRFRRRVARRHQDQRTRRSPQRAAAPSRTIRADVCGNPFDLFDGPHARVLRHADRPQNRARHARPRITSFRPSFRRWSIPTSLRCAAYRSRNRCRARVN